MTLINKLSLFLFLCIVTISPFTYANNTIVTTIEEFNFKQAPGFISDETYSQVWHFKDSTYLVWVDTNYRAQITQIKNGQALTVPLDDNPDYSVQKDGHHRFSLGVDKLGYIHVTGDMHNYTDMTSGVITPYPTRYQNKKILYWRSNKPEDISAKFSFMGDTFDRAMRGSGWMMGRFFTDNNGELFYSSHVQAFRSSTNFGQMGVGLYKYSPTDEIWTTIGANIPVNEIKETNISYVFPVLYWEYSGFNRTQFQNYQPVFKFDKTNNMYFALTGNTVASLNGANRLFFAKSEDGGMTWKRANNTAIAGLPLRGISGLANSADSVLDTGTANFLEPKPGLIIDITGKPGVMVQNKWRVWDGQAWSLNTKVNYDTMLTANMGYRLPNNSLIFNATSWLKLLRTPSFDNETIGYDFVGYDRVIGVDDFSLKTYGIIYAIG
ncbi:MAG: BNR-4 repeat-containing protein, partial [bacterium]|nr:BNR-4 repeat-containing protein [bacterium]